jgi:predicted aconitase
MKLTAEETAIRDGKRGAGAAKAMSLLYNLGRIAGATEMVPVGSVQVSGVSYKNIGEYGLAFLEEWASLGCKAVVPAFMNPGGADRKLWERLRIPAEFVAKQQRVQAALEALGIAPLLSCTPYHAGCVPAYGEHVAWAESSAVCYANSALGARTNREGGPSAIAAALTGRTPKHTLHTEEGRVPTRFVTVRCKVAGVADAGALGYLIGKAVSRDKNGGIPYIRGTAAPDGALRVTWLKALGAAMAASGSVGLYHLENVTPEAKDHGAELARGLREETVIDDLAQGYAALATGKGPPELVSLGCPHASREDLARILGLLNGRRAKVPLWISTSQVVREQAEADGVAAKLRDCGAEIVADMCMVVAPLKEMGIRTLATDSAKAACYIPSHHGGGVYYGSTEQCIEAATSGQWPAGVEWKPRAGRS